jgi:hypothetical protein
MCLSNEAAAIKLAERDNLVGELVEALVAMGEMWNAICQVNGHDPEHMSAYRQALRVIAKAREGAQS